MGKRDAFYWRKRNNGAYRPADHYRDIVMPKESACGVIIGVAAAFCCVRPGLAHLVAGGWSAFIVIVTVIARSFARDSQSDHAGRGGRSG